MSSAGSQPALSRADDRDTTSRMWSVNVGDEGSGGRPRLDSSPARSPRIRDLVRLLGTLVFSLTVLTTMWLTITAPADLRTWQLVLGVIAALGCLLGRWRPVIGMFVAGVATSVAWTLGVTVDPFLLASVGAFTFAEQRGSRRFPWWLLVSWLGLALTALTLGGPAEGTGFEERMRGALLSAIVLAAAWVMGVRTRQARLEAAARGRTDERLRLARDVHDVLSHSLGAIGVQAGVAAHVAALGEPELRATLRDVESLARSSLLDLKSLLRNERSAIPATAPAAHPLTSLLQDTARTAERSGVAVDLVVAGEVDALPVAIGTTVHRIVQEAVTNTIRHADASKLRISATALGSTVEVTVNDDGIGSPHGIREGHGLTGMRERVALLGGELSVDSTPTGFTVTALLPVSVVDEERVRT